MKKRKIFYRIMSILLIVATIMTSQSESILAASRKNQNNPGKRLSDEKKPKDRPKGKEIKTKKPIKIPYGILKSEDKLRKWKNKKELIEERTGNSKTYLNDDGTKTTLVFFEPHTCKSR